MIARSHSFSQIACHSPCVRLPHEQLELTRLLSRVPAVPEGKGRFARSGDHTLTQRGPSVAAH